MIAEKIKQVRTHKGFSQEKLAEKANLSLRTIQRVENGKTDARGDTLVRIANALNVTIHEFVDSQKEDNKTYVALLHISALSFLLFPLLGIIIPLILWIAQKDRIKDLTLNAKELLSFQITWTILLFLGFISYFIWWNYKIGIITDISPSIVSDIYMPFIVIFGILYIYNLIIICCNAYFISSGKSTWYKPRINFLS